MPHVRTPPRDPSLGDHQAPPGARPWSSDQGPRAAGNGTRSLSGFGFEAMTQLTMQREALQGPWFNQNVATDLHQDVGENPTGPTLSPARAGPANQ